MLSVIYAECHIHAHYAECHMLSVIMLNVVILTVAAPFQNCVIHPECNDPIFRCFDLAKAASKLANKTPGIYYIKRFTVVIYQCYY
jgi:hypothetical protein